MKLHIAHEIRRRAVVDAGRRTDATPGKVLVR